MEAPKSLKQKENEPTMSYINKGYYKIYILYFFLVYFK